MISLSKNGWSYCPVHFNGIVGITDLGKNLPQLPFDPLTHIFSVFHVHVGIGIKLNFLKAHSFNLHIYSAISFEDSYNRMIGQRCADNASEAFNIF